MIEIPSSPEQAGSLHHNVVPVPRWPISVRVAVASDLPFIDSLQKMHAKMVGWMPTKQLEGKIARGHVLIRQIEEQRADGKQGLLLAERRAA